jgi:hypothetical protein
MGFQQSRRNGILEEDISDSVVSLSYELSATGVPYV